MRATFRRVVLATALVGAGAMASGSPVLADAGDVTTTAMTYPAAVAGLGSEGANDDGRGGLYHVFADATELTIVRSLPDGSFDSDFGVSGALTATLADASDNYSFRWAVEPVTGDFAIVASANISVSPHVLILGSGDGTITHQADLDLSDVETECDADHLSTAGPVFANAGAPMLRSDGGFWMHVLCSVPTTDFANQTSAAYLVAFAADGTPDATVGVVYLDDPTGTGSTCSGTTSFISNPSPAAGEPDLRAIRVLHSTQNTDLDCARATSSGVGATYVGLDLLSIASDGSVTRSALSLPAASGKPRPGSVTIDPGGRAVVATSDFVDATAAGAFRLGADGTLDTNLGTDGFLAVTLPDAIGAGLTGVTFRIVGIVTTADEVNFAVQLVDRFSYSCLGAVDISAGFRIGLLSLADGWVSDFGTDGIGDSLMLERVNDSSGCPIIMYGGVGVDNDGQPRALIYNQDGSVTYNVWDTVNDATGGGTGGTGTGGFTSDTGGAPSVGDGLSTIEQPTVTTTTTTTTTVAETTTTVAEETTTTVVDDPSDAQLPATGSATPVAIAVMLVAVGALATLRRRSI